MEYATEEQLTDLIQALQSGEFKQGQKRLRTLNEDNTFSYCCLGLAQEVCKLRGVVSDCFLTREDEDQSELYFFLPRGIQNFLAKLNDNGYPFTAISSVITRIRDNIYHGGNNWENLEKQFIDASALLD